MMDLMAAGGWPMWPILGTILLALGLAVATGWKLARARRHGESADLRSELRSDMDAVLFWGGFAVVVGLVGTVGGWFQMSRYLGSAGEVSAPLIWSGFSVSLLPTLLALAGFALALLAWTLLRTAARRVFAGRRRRDGV